MSTNYMTRRMVDRLFRVMHIKGVTTSQLCKVLNVGYRDFQSMCEGKSPCYRKWQKKICETLEVDHDIIFKEFNGKPKVMYIVTRGK